MSAVTAAPVLGDEAVAAYGRDGYLVVPGFFTSGQMAALRTTLEADEALRTRSWSNDDGTGAAVEIAAWNDPGSDSFGALARNRRLVGAAAQLLGDEPYHYHSKLNSKRPGSGGTWVWHQDYGYWYRHCAYPDMLTVAVPLTPADAANGCLQVLRGSHRAGRVEHGRIGDQTGADPERVAELRARHETVRFEAEPGDVMFFHCNVLHTSEPNGSDVPRELLLVAYNARHNDPVTAHHHASYSPIDVVADSAIEEWAGRIVGERRTFIRPRRERETRSG